MITFTLEGEPASKANGRELKWNFKAKRKLLVKSDKAISYMALAKATAPVQWPLLEGDLTAIITIWYASRRPDLDESVILDALQGRIYKNDRQIKEKQIYWRLDRDNPRSVITIKQGISESPHDPTLR